MYSDPIFLIMYSDPIFLGLKAHGVADEGGFNGAEFVCG